MLTVIRSWLSRKSSRAISRAGYKVSRKAYGRIYTEAEDAAPMLRDIARDFEEAFPSRSAALNKIADLLEIAAKGEQPEIEDEHYPWASLQRMGETWTTPVLILPGRRS